MAAVLQFGGILLHGKFLEDQHSVLETSIFPASSRVQGTEETLSNCSRKDEVPVEGRMEGKMQERRNGGGHRLRSSWKFNAAGSGGKGR